MYSNEERHTGIMNLFKIFLILIFNLVHVSDTASFQKIKLNETNSKKWTKKFGGISVSQNLPDDRQCNSSCGTKRMPVCYCDYDCFEFNDCCFQAKSLINRNEIRRLPDKFTCKFPVSQNIPDPLKEPFGVVMVDTCPTTGLINSTLAKECRNSTFSPTYDHILHSVPVTSKDGTTFANVYCALCNGIVDVSLWDLDATLNVKDNIEPILLKQNSSLKYLVESLSPTPVPGTNISPRVCVRIDKPRNLANINSQMCRKYNQPVVFRGSIYQNFHCIDINTRKKCEGNNSGDCKITCIKEKDMDIRDMIFLKNRRKRSIKIRFGSHVHMEYDQSRCRSEETFPESKVKCVQLSCLNNTSTSKRESINCHTFEVAYTNYVFSLEWYIRNCDKPEISLQRYLTLLQYILSLTNIEKDRLFYMCSMKNHSYPSTVLGLHLVYKKTLTAQQALDLQNKMASLQVSYIEKSAGGRKTVAIERSFGSSEHTLTEMKVMNPLLYRQEDKALLRLLPDISNISNCQHIYLHLSVENVTNEEGETHQNYTITNYYCKNLSVAVKVSYLLVLCSVVCWVLS